MSLPSSQAFLSLSSVACAAGRRTLFEGLSIELVPGQWAALRGHNGSGKSTLLRCVAGLSQALKGEIKTQGRMLYQSHFAGWKESFTPLENLAWQAQLEGGASSMSIHKALTRVGLAEQANLGFTRLSAGQKRRVSLARLLLSPSPIWLLDEPSTALDQQGQSLFGDILGEHLSQGGIGLVATHLEFPGVKAQFTVDLGEA